jgi:hypothetical protein
LYVEGESTMISAKELRKTTKSLYDTAMKAVKELFLVVVSWAD